LATVKRRLRETVVFNGLLGAVPRMIVRAVWAAERPMSAR